MSSAGIWQLVSALIDQRNTFRFSSFLCEVETFNLWLLLRLYLIQPDLWEIVKKSADPNNEKGSWLCLPVSLNRRLLHWKQCEALPAVQQSHVVHVRGSAAQRSASVSPPRCSELWAHCPVKQQCGSITFCFLEVERKKCCSIITRDVCALTPAAAAASESQRWFKSADPR